MTRQYAIVGRDKDSLDYHAFRVLLNVVGGDIDVATICNENCNIEDLYVLATNAKVVIDELCKVSGKAVFLREMAEEDATKTA